MHCCVYEYKQNHHSSIGCSAVSLTRGCVHVLQGEIGKFGAVELSDVADFAEFPDQKVLSSTEYGNLIMWDGGLIKCVVRQPGGKPCHVGPIEVGAFSAQCLRLA